MTMERKKVQSSNIASVGWDDGTLEVEFNNGVVYQYSDVPGEVAMDMQKAESVGKFFHRTIRKAYQGRKVEA